MGMHAQKKAMFEKFKINVDGLIHKMRVLTLASVCEKRTEVPLTEIKQKLGMTDIEDLIISATHYDVVSGKIDEKRQVLTVSACLQRSFGVNEWKELDKSLEKWIEKLSALKKMHANTKSSAQSN